MDLMLIAKCISAVVLILIMIPFFLILSNAVCLIFRGIICVIVDFVKFKNKP